MLSGSSIVDVPVGGGLRIEAERGRRHGARRDRQRAQRLAGERVVAPRELRAALLAERRRPCRPPTGSGTCASRTSGAPLTKTRSSPGLSRIEMDGGVALALGGEGDFGDARKARQLGLGDAELARRDDQRAFGRIALHAPALLAVHERRVVGERRRAQRLRRPRRERGDASASGAPSTVNSPSGM